MGRQLHNNATYKLFLCASSVTFLTIFECQFIPPISTKYLIIILELLFIDIYVA